MQGQVARYRRWNLGLAGRRTRRRRLAPQLIPFEAGHEWNSNSDATLQGEDAATPFRRKRRPNGRSSSGRPSLSIHGEQYTGRERIKKNRQRRIQQDSDARSNSRTSPHCLREKVQKHKTRLMIGKEPSPIQ